MLGKLIKYDLKALAKILAPLWGVLLVMGLIFGISIRSNLDGIGNTMIVFSLVVIIAVIVAIFVMNVIIVIQRFWNGLLQEEGYLMFTLPVTTRSLILSKVISALIPVHSSECRNAGGQYRRTDNRNHYRWSF